MKKLFALVLVSGLLLVGCGKKNSGEDLSKSLFDRGYLIMGMDDTFAPMGFRDEKNELVGFDIDLAREISSEMGIEIRFQPIEWNIKEQELNSKNIDLIWNGYSITDERKEKVNFSTPYLENKQIVITLDENINSLADLKDKVVSVQNGSSTLNAINKTQVPETFKDGEAVLFDTNLEAFLDMEANRSDAVVSDEVLARYYISQKPEFKYYVLEEDFGKEEYGIGLRKTDLELLEKINLALESLKENGKYDELYNKWFK